MKSARAKGLHHSKNGMDTLAPVLPKLHEQCSFTQNSQHGTFLRAKQNPYLHTQIGVSEFNLDDDLLSHGET
ncbi:hypothetical protein ACQKPC_25590, partial [Pseudomonas sp. NPDC089918]|uniref:hypothetical protein n=1 Tax=Pseudomonas sp. NPDC089918 TaxID=3390654 RepID=UPI003D03A860